MAATVLIVGADTDSGHLADYLLRAAGYGSAFKADAEAGIGAALENTADLIVCDLDMTGIDGFALLARLQRDSRWRRIPVVALTRLTKPGDHERIKASGFTACLHKPIEPEIFASQVEKFLPPRLRRSQPLVS